MKTIESIIIGNGEVGSSLKKVLDIRINKGETEIFDKKDENFNERLNEYKCKTLHICIPYSQRFIKDVLRYTKILEPELCIIHSSVPVGTTNKISRLAFSTKIAPLTYFVHSPVRGLHPNLDKDILSFVKYVGTDSKEAFDKVKEELNNLVLKWFNKSETTELGKLLDTSYYGLCISWHREMERFCKYFKVNYKDVVTDFNISYNNGYRESKPEVIRPILYSPGKKKIGGHCVRQNAKLLLLQRKSNFLDLVK